ncbi:hypothetical protein MHLP_02995 [Candidatus Mycoplasma haematolamae str. Purdue]|uniref:Uncharacterized protein n=1 Tax=Mycoplasma haematolamae (strain Purdue) TaxID=1212765 RepID=I7CJX5_MYCHA|nr:hypothetical protein [Candidatus Mycoplasma haematolamae]AFO52179.1 hypothetical protein MHLP_02995 [Candidatus Mycoplasma haematolamae str. Purdue]
MTKIQIILSGLTAGTGVAGGTRLVSDYVGSTIIDGHSTISGDKDKKLPSHSENPQDKESQVIVENKESGDEEELKKDVPVDLAAPEGNVAETPDSSPKLPRIAEPNVPVYREDVPYEPPKATKRALPKGTRQKPDIICVIEETSEGWSPNGRRSDVTWKHRPACIVKENVYYPELLRLPVCNQDQMYSTELPTGEKVPEGLNNREKVRCRYWDSYQMSNNQHLQFTSDLVPELFSK